MARIAFIGLGNMGLPMAVNLVKAGHEVVGSDLSLERMADLEAAGGSRADSAIEAVREAEVVVTMLPSGREVSMIYLGDEGLLACAPRGTLFIDSSTIDVETARRVGDAAAAGGQRLLDAPVSGGVGGAQAGTLTFMVGGPEPAFEAARPFLEIMGRTIVHAGGSGNGQAAKICNNMILGITMIGVSEAFVLAERLGLDHQKLYDISSTASGQCWALTSYCPVPGPVPTSPANKDYAAGFAAAMMLKDLKLAQDAAAKSGATTPLGAAATQAYNLYVGSGEGATDFSGIIRFLRGEALDA